MSTANLIYVTCVMDIRKLIKDLRLEFNLNKDEELRLMQLHISGYKIATVTKSLWCVKRDKLRRITSQVISNQLMAIPDRNNLWEVIMDNLDWLESQLLAKHDPGKLDIALCILAIAPDNRPKFLSFSRTEAKTSELHPDEPNPEDEIYLR